MKKAILAAATAMAALAMTPAAHAADYVIDLSGDFDDGFSVDIPATTFSQHIDFVMPAKGHLTGSVSSTTANIFSTLDPLKVELFKGSTSIGILGYTIVGHGFSNLTDLGFVTAGNYSLYFTGTAKATGSVSGTITLTPSVPEPATWAMMIVGVAAIGTTMRRSQKARIAFS